MRCQKCGDKTEVLETQQSRKGTRRRRQCLNPHCQLRITTYELMPAEARQRSDAEFEDQLSRLRPGRGYDPEALAAALTVDRRKEEIKRAQRAARLLEEYDDEDFPDHLSEADARRELRGY